MNDIRFAVRQLLKAPGFTAVAVLILALGIGASTATFSALDAALLRPLPYPEPGRLVQLLETLPDGSLNGVSGGAFLDWREHQTQLASIVLVGPVTRNLRGDGEPERLQGLEVTHEFLGVLGVQPKIGRGLLPEDEHPGGDSHVVVITDELWRSRLGGREPVLGSTLVLDDVPHTVVGVLPEGSLPDGIWRPGSTRFVVPAVPDRHAEGRLGGKYSRFLHWATVFGRLKPGVSVAQADAELKVIKAQLNPEYPPYKRDWGTAVLPLGERLAAGSRPVLFILVGAVAALLLIACANVAGLLLARARHRQREIALRVALGASGRRIMRQVLTESLVLAALGGAVGTLLSFLGIGLLRGLTPGLLPGGVAPRLDGWALAASLLLTGVTGLLFGILPAWQARRPNLNRALQSGGKSATARDHHRTQSLLVVAEVALTVVLLVAAGLLLRSLARTIETDPGFEPQHVLAFDLSLPDTTYETGEARYAFSREALARIRSLPGVAAAGTGMAIPFSGGAYGEFVGRAGAARAEDNPVARVNYVSEGYLEALGARLLAGRRLRQSDDGPDAARVVVVNHTTARRFFPGENAVGRSLSMLGREWRIVGIIADVPDRHLDQPSDLFLYVPHVFNPERFSIVVRTSLDPLSLVGSIRREIQRLDPGLPLADVRPLEEAMQGSMSGRRIVLGLVGSFAAVALALACIGLYGVMAYSVALRRRELSIRQALGATRPNVVGLILRNGVLLTSVGLALGVGGALGAARLLAHQLYQVSGHDPLVIAGTVLFVALAALLACWVPARRASRMDPVEALRME
jgi:predicted permease